MLRTLGIGLILLLTFYLSHSMSVMERQRVRQTEGFLLILRHIRTHISCFRTPLPEIYADFDNPALREAGFLDALADGGFCHALDNCRERLYLDEEEWKVLYNFGGGVGNSYLGEQSSLCDYTLAEMEKAMARRREEAPKRTRVSRTVIICGGFMLVFLLL